MAEEPKVDMKKAYEEVVDDLMKHLGWIGKKLFDFKGEVLALSDPNPVVTSKLILAYQSLQDSIRHLNESKESFSKDDSPA